MKLLRDRLAAAKVYGAVPPSDRVDQRLREAVALFQKKNGLSEQRGILTPETMAAAQNLPK